MSFVFLMFITNLKKTILFFVFCLTNVYPSLPSFITAQLILAYSQLPLATHVQINN